MNMEDGDVSLSSKSQQALWGAWVDTWDYVNSIKVDREVVVVFGGELGELDAKNRTSKVHSRNPNDVMGLVWDTIQPALQVADKVIVLRGTEAHVGVDSSFDEAVAQRITNTVRGYAASHYYERFVIGGYKFDLAHHVSMGSAPWTQRNAANALASKLTFNYVDWDEKLPDFAIRGHVHRLADSGMNYKIRALISPCWTLHGPYSHRIGVGESRPEIGVIIIDTETKEVSARTSEPTRDAPINLD
jgi:hypothetical protein